MANRINILCLSIAVFGSEAEVFLGQLPIRSDTNAFVEALCVMEFALRIPLIGRKIEIIRGRFQIFRNAVAVL
jgi:hypothetical protein